jgi:hypothetical protein
LFQHLHGGTENITENSVRLHGLQAEVWTWIFWIRIRISV